MKVRFWFRKQQTKQKTKQGIIYATITINKKRSQPFSTGICLEKTEWDTKKQRIVNTRKAAYNDELANIEAVLLTIKNNLQAQKLPITSNIVRAEWLKQQALPPSIIALIDAHIEHQAKFGKGKKGKPLSEGTYQTYRTYKTYLLDFLEQNKSLSDTAQEINANWLNRYEAYAVNRTTKKRLKQHSVNLSIAYVKQVLRFAIANELITKAPAIHYKIKPAPKPYPNPLTDSEISKLETTAFSPYQTRAVDCFLFMRYTSLHYIDAKQITPNALKTDLSGNQFLLVVRQKTEETALIPYHAKAKAIVEKYGGLDKLPFTDFNNITRHIRSAAKIAGIARRFALGSARDTFADDCSNNMLMSDESLAAILGHTSTNYVRKYRRINIDRITKEWKA